MSSKARNFNDACFKLRYLALSWTTTYILFPKEQGLWSIAVTVPVFKISIPRLFTTKITKSYPFGNFCLFVFLISNIHLINTLSNLLNFYFKQPFLSPKMITSYLKECSRKDFFIFCFTSIVHKGQLISEWLLDVFIWTKKRTKIFLYFCPTSLKYIGQIKKRMQVIILEDK